MLHNFMITLVRFRMASTINLLGLTTAYIAIIIIGLQIITEYSHDTTYPDHDRIYRVERTSFRTEGAWATSLSRPMIDEIVKSTGNIEQHAIIRQGYRSVNSTDVFRVQGDESRDNLIQNSIVRVSLDFPDMFGMKMVEGHGLGSDPRSVIIPRSMVKKYFDDRSSLGKTLESVKYGGQPIIVSGVYEDFPLTSSFENRIYCNAADSEVGLSNYKNFELYLKLSNGADLAAITAKLNQIVKADSKNGEMQLRVSKFSDSYLASDMDDTNAQDGLKLKLKLFGFIALLIIFIASINYINFAMALVPVRMRSINTRKIFGASNAQLRWQLISESVGLSLIAYLVAVLVIATFDTLDSISFIPTTVLISDNISTLFYVGLAAIALGVITGIYPALYSTSFKTAYALSGSFTLSPKGRWMRTVLIGFQFVISTGLIVAAIFMNMQFSMIRNQDLGINRVNILQLKVSNELSANIGQFRSELSGVAGVKQTTLIPGHDGIVSDQYSSYAFNKEEDIRMYNIHGPSNMVDFFGLNITQGRNFASDDDLKAVNSTVIINETAQKKFNIKIGDRLGQINSVYDGYTLSSDSSMFEVVGVVADFNFKPLYEQVSPIMIINYGTVLLRPGESTMYIKVQTDNYQHTIEAITEVAKKIHPDWVADVSLLDYRIEQLYRDDLRSTSLVGWFSLLAIMISLGGIFGLVHFETKCRRKEIGLRRINGATIAQILSMLSLKFVIISVVCYMIAVPLSIYFIVEWLKEFAYRTPLYWWVFIVVMVIVLTLIVGTVIVQAYNTARENPVNSIKSE